MMTEEEIAGIEDDLLNHQGEIANNFIQKISDARQSLKAIGMFKDVYLLDFINVIVSKKVCPYKEKGQQLLRYL